MTEKEFAQFARLPQLAGLPTYEESDVSNCETLDRPQDGSGVHEASTVDEMRKFLADASLVPRGAIRFHDGGTRVRFYFHKPLARMPSKRK